MENFLFFRKEEESKAEKPSKTEDDAPKEKGDKDREVFNI